MNNEKGYNSFPLNISQQCCYLRCFPKCYYDYDYLELTLSHPLKNNEEGSDSRYHGLASAIRI